MSGPIVEIAGVHKYFGAHHVLRGVDLAVRRGEVVVIIGPSGSGKSTLLRCVNHLERIDDGRILVDGQPIGYRETNGRRVDSGTPRRPGGGGTWAWSSSSSTCSLT